MMINLHPEFIAHVDQKSIELIDSLLQRKKVKSTPEKSQGSIEEKDKYDMTNKIDPERPINWSKVNYNGQTVEKWCEVSEEEVGYDESSYKSFKKFVTSIGKKKELNALVTTDIVEDIVFEWLVNSKLKNQISKSLSLHLIETIEEGCVERSYCFPILNLEITQPVKLEDVIISYFTEEDFDELALYHAKLGLEKTEEENELLKKKYKGTVVVKTVAYGHPKRAEQIAYEKCSMVVDIMKMCSDTQFLPDLPLSFDIDNKVREQTSSMCFSHDPTTFTKLNISFRRKGHTTLLDLNLIQEMERRYVRNFSNYFLDTENETELFKLLSKSVKQLSSAFSNPDLHERIVSLFTIYETLLLPNENAPILESLTKYGPKLVFKKSEDRKHLKKLLVSQYDIRSKMVHHAKRIDIDLHSLKQLQLALIILISNLINMNKTFGSKDEILQEIDEAINSAF